MKISFIKMKYKNWRQTMKTKGRLLMGVLCMLMAAFCALIFTACGGDDKCSHQWGEWTIKENATCTREGTQERKCSECGDIETSSIAALGHTWKDATCTAPKTCLTCQATEGSATGHTGGTATCKDKAKCSVCGAEYGELTDHTPIADDGDCTTAITCSICGKVTTEAKASHTGGTATCKDKAECMVCGKGYGEFANHIPNADDGDCTTAITCSVCGAVTTAAKENHTGGTATCQARAVCTVCNSEYGNYGLHNYDETTWGYKDANGHAHVCSVTGCNEHSAVVGHTSSGLATETVAEKCTICQYIMTPAIGHITHTPESEWTKNETYHWHECEGCEDQEFDKEEHIYDNVCDAVCNACGYERIVTHLYTDLKHDANKHWYECVVCYAVELNSTEVHKGGVATCTDKAECTVCGTEYGAFATHSLIHHAAVSATCTTNGNIEYWSCSVCGMNYADAGAATEVSDVVILASHTGGTEIRNYKAPTEYEKGYSGDIYCLGCEQIISLGVELPSISNRPTILVSDAVVEQGEDTVKIMIFIENNPGIVSLKFDVLYSDVLTIQSVEFESEFGAYATAPSPYINPQTFNWISFGEDETIFGCFVTITFFISSEVTESTLADISIILDNDNIFNSEMDLIQFDTVNATVTIKR